MNGTLAGLMAILMWSCLPILIVSSGEVPGFLLASLSFFFGFIILTITQIYKKEDVISYWKQPFKYYLFTVVGIGGYTTLLYLSFKSIPAFEANTLNYLWPILLVAVTGLISKNKFSFNVIIGALLGFIGVLLLFYPKEGQAFFTNFAIGHVFVLIAVILWVIYSILARYQDYPQGIMAPTFFFSSLICLVFHFIFEQTVLPQSSSAWFAVILLGVLRISYSFWDYGMKQGNVAILASVSYFIPLLSTVLLVFWGIHPENEYIALGAVFVIVGCLAANADQIIKKLKK